MKKTISIILAIIILMSTTVGCFAQETHNGSYFISEDDINIFFLINESSTANIEDVVFTDKDGNIIDEKQNVYTGCSAQLEGESGQYQVVLAGDVNGDGFVNASDARIAMRAAAKIELLNDFLLFAAADTDCSGKITAKDARKILRVSADVDTFDDFEKCFRDKAEETTETDKSTVGAVLKDEYIKSAEDCKACFLASEFIKDVVVGWTLDGEMFFEFILTESGTENYDATVELIENSNFFRLVG